MTQQEAITYLSRYTYAQIEADRLEEEIKRWRSRAERVTATISFLPGGGTAVSQIELTVEKLDELITQLRARQQDCLTLRDNIDFIINAIANENERQVLRLRYLERQKFERIAEKMNYSRQQIWVLHKRAIANILQELELFSGLQAP